MAENIPWKRDYLQVHVRFFAAHREILGSDRLTVELPDQATAAVLVETVGARFPTLKATLGAARVAVNREYATPTTILRDGDEVALIPPVAGGKD
jgi:molybdopterin converting factor subunit 1